MQAQRGGYETEPPPCTFVLSAILLCPQRDHPGLRYTWPVVEPELPSQSTSPTIQYVADEAEGTGSLSHLRLELSRQQLWFTLLHKRVVAAGIAVQLNGQHRVSEDHDVLTEPEVVSWTLWFDDVRGLAVARCLMQGWVGNLTVAPSVHVTSAHPHARQHTVCRQV